MGPNVPGPDTKKTHPWLLRPAMLLLPLVGMLLFVLLYLLATFHYPGGSYAMPQKDGFSFWHNYLCDLLDQEAINGELNGASSYARWALGVLCASLLWLWANLPRLFNRKSWNLYLMWVMGLLAVLAMAFLGSETHDSIVRISGAFGLVALVSCIVELHKAGYPKLAILGSSCLLVFLLNYYIYETGILMRSLPVIQKLTFALFLLWFALLNRVLLRQLRHGGMRHGHEQGI